MSDKETNDTLSPEEMLLTRHRKEKRELQARVQQLKKSVNKDKKKKKEVTEEIARIEKELKERHEQELADLKKSETEVNAVSNNVDSLNLSEEGHEQLDEDNEDFATTEAEKNEGSGRKLSKAEKRRQKKAEANREREARIREEEANNKYCARNVEAEKLRQLLRERKLKMYDIKPDGDCMYAAIAHQLGEDTTVSWLRSQAGQYIRSNYDDFAPFITDPKTGEVLTLEQFSEYCDRIENTPMWGGQPELRALSEAIKRRIEVVQAEGSPVVCGEDCEGKKTIFLAYYRHYYGLGEHYNSVVAFDPPSEEAESR